MIANSQFKIIDSLIYCDQVFLSGKHKKQLFYTPLETHT